MYSPFLIANYTVGKSLERAPWLVPQDAFPVLVNGRVIKGVLEKRKGYTLLDSTGADLPIIGIFEARYQGLPRILVCDTKRVYSYNVTLNTLTDLSLADTFTGTDADFFRFQTYYEKTYFTNGVDVPYVWDDSTDTLAAIVTAGAVTIQKCDGLFMLKSRLHLVGPTIGGVYYPGRIYYTDVGLATITNATQYYSYERDDIPVSYAPLDMNNELIFGRNSAWRVEYTGDSSNPFRCATVDRAHGCLTPFVNAEYQSPTQGRVITTISRNHLVGFDGYQFRNLDWPIRDITAEMTMSHMRYCQAARLTERESVYYSYPGDGMEWPNRILEYGIDDNAWALHRISMHCLCATSGEIDPAYYTMSAKYIGRISQGYTYAGDRTGNLYRLDYGDSDNGSAIPFEVRSASLNPFVRQGRKAYLGWIDLYMDADPNVSFTMYLYKDDRTTDYKTVTVSGLGSGERFWQRVNIGGEVGCFHRIRISNDATGNRPRIHAMCPWFKMGGKIATMSVADDWPDQTWRLYTKEGKAIIQRKESGVWLDYQSWGDVSEIAQEWRWREDGGIAYMDREESGTWTNHQSWP
jgi:hypothetical protein